MSKVLIVDDDQDMLMMLALHFEQAEAEVVTTAKPLEARELISAELNANSPFNLVVLDIRMPQMDGNELTRQLREAGHTGGIVAFTSSPSEEGEVESGAAGIDAYFSKQTLKPELVRALIDRFS